MRTMVIVSSLAMLLFATTASAVGPCPPANVLVNGSFDNGENGWTRWQAPWGAGNWAVEDCQCGTGCQPPCDPPMGHLFLNPGQAGSFGWYQRISVIPSEIYTLSGCWCGDVCAPGWAEVMMFTSTEGWSDADVVNRIDTGNAADIIVKKDGWGLNPPCAWDCEDIAYSLHPSGPGSLEIHATCAEIVVALKLGANPGAPWVCYDNLSLVPEPATMLLLGIPVLFLRRRRA